MRGNHIPEGREVKSPAICLHILRSGVVVALDDAEFEVVVGKLGVADDPRECPYLVVELRHRVTALEREAECVQVLLRVLQHLIKYRRIKHFVKS